MMQNILSLGVRVRILVRVANVELLAGRGVRYVHDMALREPPRSLLGLLLLMSDALVLELLRLGFPGLLWVDERRELGGDAGYRVLPRVRF